MLILTVGIQCLAYTLKALFWSYIRCFLCCSYYICKIIRLIKVMEIKCPHNVTADTVPMGSVSSRSIWFEEIVKRRIKFYGPYTVKNIITNIMQ